MLYIICRLECMDGLLGYIADRHGLEPYASLSGYDSVKDAFTAEKHIFHARHSLYVHITGGIHGCKVSVSTMIC